MPFFGNPLYLLYCPLILLQGVGRVDLWLACAEQFLQLGACLAQTRICVYPPFFLLLTCGLWPLSSFVLLSVAFLRFLFSQVAFPTRWSAYRRLATSHLSCPRRSSWCALCFTEFHTLVTPFLCVNLSCSHVRTRVDLLLSLCVLLLPAVTHSANPASISQEGLMEELSGKPANAIRSYEKTLAIDPVHMYALSFFFGVLSPAFVSSLFRRNISTHPPLLSRCILNLAFLRFDSPFLRSETLVHIGALQLERGEVLEAEKYLSLAVRQDATAHEAWCAHVFVSSSTSHCSCSSCSSCSCSSFSAYSCP